jgi:hypothetical protein
VTVRSLLPIALLALALAACGAPTPPAPTGPATTDGVSYTVEDGEPVLALAVGFADATATLTAADAVAPAAVSELYEGFFVGPFAVAVDGAFPVAFPEADAMPAAALVLLAESFPLNLSTPECAPTVAPLAARATQTIFLGFGIPGMVALTAEGPYLTLATDVQVVDGTMLEDFTGSIFTWLFVDRDATLVSGAACVGVDVDLDLAAGWNQVAWTVEGPSDVRARVVDPTPFFAATIMPLTPPSEPEPPELMPLGGSGGSVGWLPVR